MSTVSLLSIPWEGGGNFPAEDAKAKPKDVMQPGLRVLSVVYEMEGMEAHFETCARLHVSALPSKRALLARSASVPALSDASLAALIDQHCLRPQGF